MKKKDFRFKTENSHAWLACVISYRSSLVSVSSIRSFDFISSISTGLDRYDERPHTLFSSLKVIVFVDEY